MSGSGNTDVFKRFALSLYRRAGVADACLHLQNRHDLDVNMVLFAAYVMLAKRHGPALETPADAVKVDRYFPSQAARDLLVAVLVLVGVFVLTLQHHGAPLERGGKAGGPRAGGTKRKAVTLCNPLQCRAAVQCQLLHSSRARVR